MDSISYVSNFRSFPFTNNFFIINRDSNHEILSGIPYLYTQEKTWALKEANEAGDRSRYIVRGRDVVELGNYQVVELRQGSSTRAKRKFEFHFDNYRCQCNWINSEF